MPRVYCAGPLFNVKEQEEMQELAEAFEGAGFDTFLPQRDGLELSACTETLVEKGMSPGVAADRVSKAIFALDVYQVLEGSDAIVVNLNGRVPDEGAVSEAAIAWCYGKPVVGYKADRRSVFHGQDNPLVAGLFEFNVCHTIKDAVSSMNRLLAETPAAEARVFHRERQIAGWLELGKRLSQAISSENKTKRLAAMLLEESVLLSNQKPSAAISSSR